MSPMPFNGDVRCSGPSGHRTVIGGGGLTGSVANLDSLLDLLHQVVTQRPGACALLDCPLCHGSGYVSRLVVGRMPINRATPQAVLSSHRPVAGARCQQLVYFRPRRVSANGTCPSRSHLFQCATFCHGLARACHAVTWCSGADSHAQTTRHAPHW